MKTPFTLQQFLDVFKAYNESVYPMQLVLYAAAIIILVLVFQRGTNTAPYINLVLAFFWLWMGFIYHLVFFSPINKAAYLFSALFIIQSCLLVYYGAYKDRLHYQFTRSFFGGAGAVLLAYALLFYPLIGNFSSHAYPYAPTFGLPCPTTIFTIGLLLNSKEKLPVPLLIIPVLWSALGTFAALSLGIYEDILLPLAGGLLLLYRLFPAKPVHPPYTYSH